MGSIRRPSTSWFWAAGLVALLGLGGALVWGVLDYQELQDRLDALPRTTVPGVVTAEVSSFQGLTVYRGNRRAAVPPACRRCAGPARDARLIVDGCAS